MSGEQAVAIVDSGFLARGITAGFLRIPACLNRSAMNSWLVPPDSNLAGSASATSANHCDVVAPGTTFGDYWYANLRHTVRVLTSRRRTVIRVEHGRSSRYRAHPALLFAIGQNCEGAANLPDGPAVLVGSARRASGLLMRCRRILLARRSPTLATRGAPGR